MIKRDSLAKEKISDNVHRLFAHMFAQTLRSKVIWHELLQ